MRAATHRGDLYGGRRPEGPLAAHERPARARLDPSEIVAEPMLVGNEVSAESISEGDDHVVVAVTQKHTDEATRVEIEQVVPRPCPATPSPRSTTTSRAC